MNTSRTPLYVRVLACCLTICQFAAANAANAPDGSLPATNRTQLRKKPPGKKAIPDKVFATAAVRADEEELNFATAERADMGGYTVPRTWLSADQTIAQPIPLNGMLVTQASLRGEMSKFNASAPIATTGTSINSTSTSNSFGSELSLSYGLGDNFYFTASGYYMPSRSESQQSTSYAGAGSKNLTSTDDGWHEPTIGVGLTGRVGRQSRLTLELDGDIPLGKRHSETTGNNTVSNGLSGGALRPRVMAVSKVGSVKLIGMLSYAYLLERTTDTVVDGRTGSTVTTGGNSFGTAALIEFPRAFNLGFGGIYSRSEPTSTTSYYSYGSNGANPYNSQSSTQGRQAAGGVAYMGFTIPDTNIVLMPTATYMTMIDRSLENNISVSQYDIWQFSFKGIVHF